MPSIGSLFEPSRVIRARLRKREDDSTHQVNEVTEVLLDLLRRQTPHQVQSTVELLVSLQQTQIRTVALVRHSLF